MQHAFAHSPGEPDHPMRATLERAHQQWRASRFSVDIARTDTTVETFVRDTCTSVDAANEAMGRASLGGVMLARPFDRVAP